MAKRTRNRTKIKQRKQLSKHFFWKTFALFCVLIVLMIGLLKKNQILFYYSMYFKENKNHKKLTNTTFETQRIQKIVEKYSDKTFGLDISHYQKKEDVIWDSLNIANGSIPLEFIVLRATMGDSSKDKNFTYFWQKAQEHQLIRGAYHFYRPDEDPIKQAESYLKVVDLRTGDLRPVLDIEKLPRRKSYEQYLEDIQTWLNIVEKTYGKKPIIYTYYHFYKDYLRGKFDEYPLWLANYNDVAVPSEEDEWKIWQFTENGISQGVNSKIDLNIYNGTKWQMRELFLD